MNTYKKLINFFKQISIFDEILSILEWDTATMMPVKSRASRINQIKVITQKKKDIFNQIQKLELFKSIKISQLNKNESRNFKLMKKKFQIFQFIPSELTLKNQKLAYDCEGKWRKQKNNYNIVKEALLNFINLQEKIKNSIRFMNTSEYDALLSLYDQSFNSKEIKNFAREIEFFIKKICKLYRMPEKKVLEFDSFLSK